MALVGADSEPMTRDERKAAMTAYRERKVFAGIYALRCGVTGETWAGAALDLSTIRNRVWFALKQRSHQRPALQAAWDNHGATGLRFEEVERLPLDDADYIRDVVLKERLVHWRTRLNAELI